MFFLSIDKADLTIYQELQLLKYAKKLIIGDYLEMMNSHISHLQNNSSAVIESNINRRSKIFSSSNISIISYILSFSTCFNKRSEINQTVHQIYYYVLSLISMIRGKLLLMRLISLLQLLILLFLMVYILTSHR